MIHIESRNADDLLVVHEWSTVEAMLADYNSGNPSIGDNLIQLVTRDGQVLYSSLGSSEAYCCNYLRSNKLMDWFFPSAPIQRMREAPKALTGSREIRLGDFALLDDAAEWMDSTRERGPCWSYALIPNCNVDELLGTHIESDENDDYLNIYAMVQAGYDGVDEALEINLCKPDGGIVEYVRILNEAEQLTILTLVQRFELDRLRRAVARFEDRLAAAQTTGHSTEFEPVCLNERLLNLILFLQRSRDSYISKAEILGLNPNWYELVYQEYCQLPNRIFEQARISKNQHNFDRALHFTVTPEMMQCKTEALGQFPTAFWR